MKRTSTLLLTALLLAPACDSGEAKNDAKAAAEKKSDPAPAQEIKQVKLSPDIKAPAGQEAPAERIVASGLDIGQRFVAFDILNCESGDEYCQVCKFGGSPKIMAVGTIDDPAFRKDLQDLDEIGRAHV